LNTPSVFNEGDRSLRGCLLKYEIKISLGWGITSIEDKVEFSAVYQGENEVV
jgi:hypothetical protein